MTVAKVRGGEDYINTFLLAGNTIELIDLY